jgi:hypothetical protein
MLGVKPPVHHSQASVEAFYAAISDLRSPTSQTPLSAVALAKVEDPRP